MGNVITICACPTVGEANNQTITLFGDYFQAETRTILCVLHLSGVPK